MGYIQPDLDITRSLVVDELNARYRDNDDFAADTWQHLPTDPKRMLSSPFRYDETGNLYFYDNLVFGDIDSQTADIRTTLERTKELASRLQSMLTYLHNNEYVFANHDHYMSTISELIATIQSDLDELVDDECSHSDKRVCEALGHAEYSEDGQSGPY